MSVFVQKKDEQIFHKCLFMIAVRPKGFVIDDVGLSLAARERMGWQETSSERDIVNRGEFS